MSGPFMATLKRSETSARRSYIPVCLRTHPTTNIRSFKITVPHINGVPRICPLYDGILNSPSFRYNYCCAPYSIFNSDIGGSVNLVNSAVYRETNTIATYTGGTQQKRLAFRLLNSYRTLQDAGYSYGNLSGISYRNGLASADLGGYVVVPLDSSRRFIVTCVAFSVATTGDMPSYSTEGYTEPFVDSRYLYANTDSYTPTQLASLIGGNVTHTYTYTTNLNETIDNRWPAIVFSMRAFVNDTSNSYLYIELPRLTSTAFVDGGDTTGTLYINDVFWSITMGTET